MGLFELFGRERKSKSNATLTDFEPASMSNPQQGKAPVSIFKPASFDDVASIIDALNVGKTAIVHLTSLKAETQVRVIDILSGAIYALGGGVYEMEKNVFMFSPSGLEIY